MVRVFFLSVLLSTPALAGDSAPKTKKKRADAAVTKIDFDAVDVQAKAARPWSWFIDGRVAADFDSLIVLRKDFDHEIKATTTEIQ